MNALLAGFAAVAGLLNAVQAGCNATLGKSLGPFPAALVVAAVSFVTILLAALVSGRFALPEWRAMVEAPWWAWVGGTLAAVFVLSQLLAAEALGSALFMGLAVTAAIVMSLALDHWGLAGFKQHPLGWARAVGAVLMLAGLGLIARY